MFEILNFRYMGYAFAERQVISRHESIRAAVKKADYLSKNGTEVLIPLPGGYKKCAIVFSLKSADKFKWAAMDYGFQFLEVKLYLDDGYMCRETGEIIPPTQKRFLVEKTFEFNSKTGEYNEIGEPSVQDSEEEISDAFDLIEKEHAEWENRQLKRRG
jgi:hypothetical protein